MTPEQLLKEGLMQIGFSCSEKQLNAFMTFLSELKKWNRVYNLTSLKADEDIIIKHFLDSLLYLKAIEEIASPRNFGACNDRMRRLKIADIGTGAGFPGIPIKIIRPDIELVLVDSSRKKCAFLKHITRTLKLNMVSVKEERVEALGKDHEKSYDVIVSRATFKIKAFLEKARPYVKKNGMLILSKGPKAAEEINELGDKKMIKKIRVIQFVIKVSPTGRQAERNLLIIRN